jgi:hypothetical protein
MYKSFFTHFNDFSIAGDNSNGSAGLFAGERLRLTVVGHHEGDGAVVVLPLGPVAVDLSNDVVGLSINIMNIFKEKYNNVQILVLKLFLQLNFYAGLTFFFLNRRMKDQNGHQKDQHGAGH